MTRHKRKQRGMTAMMTLALVMGGSIMAMGVITVATFGSRMSGRSVNKAQANNLAESAIFDIYTRIQSDMRAKGNYPFTLDSRELTYQKSVDKTLSLGRYEAKVVSVQTAVEDVNYGGNTKRRTTYSFLVEGTGRSQLSLTKMRARFNATVEWNLKSIDVANPNYVDPGQIYYPAAAIASQEPVVITTNNGLRTSAPDGRSGHVVSNEGIVLKPASGNKSAMTNPNVCDIQGQYIVHQDAYAYTVGPNGLGNINGGKNYRSPSLDAIGTFPGNPADTVLKTDNLVNFADAATVGGWKSKWVKTATKTGANLFNGNVTSNALLPRAGDGWKVVRAPAYIDGDLEVKDGEQLRLLPNSSDPTENVVYVKGNVKNYGALLNLGVTLVFEGTYDDCDKGQYKVDTVGTPFDTTSKVLQNSAMVSLAQRKDAIRFGSNASVTTGLIYSANGGIRVDSANLEISGILVAGGRGGNGGVDVKPGGGASFVVHYTPEAASLGELTADTNQTNKQLITDGIYQPFTAQPIRDWIDLKNVN